MLNNRQGPLSKLIKGGIGIAQEFNADRKERKAAAEAQTAAASAGGSSQDHLASHAPYESEEDIDDDEEWALSLDEAQQLQLAQEGTVGAASGASDARVDVDTLLQDFVSRHPAPQISERWGALPMPVILPQRRPESRHRGFVRAYAPVLAECGIDQATWLEFLDGFEKSIKSQPWFHVANFAAFASAIVADAIVGISPITFAVTFALHTGIEAGRRTYIHQATNKYLDKMNDQFFKPRGLFCMIFKYKPESKDITEDIDMQSNIVRAVDKRDHQSKWSKFFIASAGTTKNDLEIPDPAPLVFPQLDNMNPAQKENTLKHFNKVVSNYLDRQAQTKFEAANPDSKIPSAPIAGSSHSSSSQPAGSGGLLSTITGGAAHGRVGPLQRINDRRNDKRQRLGIGRQVGRDARKERRKNRPLKKMLKEDAMYLMVVNLPSQEEMDRAAALIEQAASRSA